MNYGTNLYGFAFGEVAEKQGQDMLHSMEMHCKRVTQDGTSSLDNWCTVKEEIISQFSVKIYPLSFEIGP